MKAKTKRYEELIRAYHVDIYRYALWLCRDQHLAEDIVQETFLRAWRSLDSLKDEKAAKGWLITIVRRENARHFERKRLVLVDIESQPVSDTFNASTEQQMEIELLRRRIDQLGSKYREPLILQVMCGFSIEEIAGILDINKNLVVTRLFRARNQLKEVSGSQYDQRGCYNG